MFECRYPEICSGREPLSTHMRHAASTLWFQAGPRAGLNIMVSPSSVTP